MDRVYTNVFIAAAKAVFSSFCVDINALDIVHKTSPFQADTLVIVIGLTGDLHGQAIISMHRETACKISSVMMGFEVEELSEEVKSAIAELFNMITGNAVTLLSQENILLDMTPPSVLTGENIHVSTTLVSSVIMFNVDGAGIMELALCAKELNIE